MFCALCGEVPGPGPLRPRIPPEAPDARSAWGDRRGAASRLARFLEDRRNANGKDEGSRQGVPIVPPQDKQHSEARGAPAEKAAEPDVVDRASEDSFPASDPPAWIWSHPRA
jgi:hypothetical protein